MMKENCDCTLETLRLLIQIESLQEQTTSLDRTLELSERCEAQCLTIVGCPRCHAHRFALVSAMLLNTSMADKLATLNTNRSMEDAPVMAINIGAYDLDSADTSTLLHELVSLRLGNLSCVQSSLSAGIADLEKGKPSSGT